MGQPRLVALVANLHAAHGRWFWHLVGGEFDQADAELVLIQVLEAEIMGPP